MTKTPGAESRTHPARWAPLSRGDPIFLTSPLARGGARGVVGGRLQRVKWRECAVHVVPKFHLQTRAPRDKRRVRARADVGASIVEFLHGRAAVLVVARSRTARHRLRGRLGRIAK